MQEAWSVVLLRRKKTETEEIYYQPSRVMKLPFRLQYMSKNHLLL